MLKRTLHRPCRAVQSRPPPVLGAATVCRTPSLLPRPSTMLASEQAQPRSAHARLPAPCRAQQDSEKPASEVAQGPAAMPGSYRIALLVALLAGAAVAAATGAGSELLEAVEAAIAGDSSVTGQVLFVVVYALATVLLFPASVLTLAAGALFGPLQGTALVSAASTLGAALAFLTSRYLARPLVEERLPQYPRLQAIVKSISSQGIKLVLLLRLSPVFPFNILNYALGLTSIGFWEYVAASWAGMLPGTFAYVFLGGAGRVAANAATTGVEPAKVALYVVGAVATLAVTKVASDAASAAIKQQEEQEQQGGGQA